MKQATGGTIGERLTPRERFGLLVIDENPDRCPVIPLVTSHAAAVADIQLKRYYTDGTAMAEAQLIALEEYRHDAISIFSEVGIIAEALGSEFFYPDDDLPVLKVPALEKTGVHDLVVPNPKNDKRLPLYREAIGHAYRAVGDTVPILGYVPAPFTTGMMLADQEQFLVATLKNPALIHSLMEISLKAAIEFCYDIIDAGALPIIVDPLASSSVVSPRVYQELALPYEQALIRFLHRYDFDVILHICGDTGPILQLLPLTGADLVSLDQVALATIVEQLSPTMRIIGNFNTSSLAFRTPAEIRLEVQQMVKKGKTATKGYIASTGCEVPIRAPVENVRAFIDAAKEVGWYWE